MKIFLLFILNIFPVLKFSFRYFSKKGNDLRKRKSLNFSFDSLSHTDSECRMGKIFITNQFFLINLYALTLYILINKQTAALCRTQHCMLANF